MGEVTPPAADAIVVAVDGGGSKTDAVALDLEGRVLARAKGPGSSPQILGIHEAADVVDGLMAEIIRHTDHRPIRQINAYISGLDLDSEVAEYGAHLTTFAWARTEGTTAVVENDLFALLRTGTRAACAVAVVCGTGINAIGIRPGHPAVRFPALGMISGDWGGGWHLGEQSVWHAARAADGRGPDTLLQRRIPEHLEVGSMREVIEAIHFGRFPNERLSELSPVLFACSDAGDPVAQRLVDRQSEEIAVLATTALRRLELLAEHVPVVLGGGVVASGNPRLVDGIASRLQTDAPNAFVEFVSSPPILGAGLLTLEAVGVSANALNRAASSLR